MQSSAVAPYFKRRVVSLMVQSGVAAQAWGPAFGSPESWVWIHFSSPSPGEWRSEFLKFCGQPVCLAGIDGLRLSKRPGVKQCRGEMSKEGT